MERGLDLLRESSAAMSYSRESILPHHDSALGGLASALDWIKNVTRDQGVNASHKAWAFNLLQNHMGLQKEERTERAMHVTRLLALGVKFVEVACDGPIADRTYVFWAAARS